MALTLLPTFREYCAMAGQDLKPSTQTVRAALSVSVSAADPARLSQS